MDYFYRQVCECLSSAESVTPGKSYAATTWSCSTCVSTSGLFVQATNVCWPFLLSLHLVQFRMPVLKLPGQKEIFLWTLLMPINPAFGLTKRTHIISLCMLLKCRITKFDSSDL